MINDSWMPVSKGFRNKELDKKFLSFLKCLNFTFVLRICAGSLDFAGTKIREQKTNNLSQQRVTLYVGGQLCPVSLFKTFIGF